MSKNLDGEIQSSEFAVIGGENTEQDCVIYNVNTKQARQLPKLQVQRCAAASVKVGSKVYAIAGAKSASGLKPYKSGEVLDLIEQTKWVAIPDMNEARFGGGAGFIADYIYVTGGYNGNPLASCERFDIHKENWSNINDMLHERESHGTIVYDGSLYCIGGYDGYKSLSSCERYDVKSDEWNEIAPLNEARASLATVVLEGNIYAIGGASGDKLVNTVEKYDPKENKWKIVTSLNIARSSSSACVVGNKIYVIGGWDGKNNLKSVEVYDPTTDVWTIAFETHQPVYTAAVVAI